jgi:hypothetical protein
MSDRKAVTEAVNFLILAPNYAGLINEMTTIIENWDEHPMAYSGKLSCLNALLDVGLQSREAFERLLKLVEEKRKLVPTNRRTDYQRNLMRARRARIAKSVELAEALSGTKMDAAQKKEHTKTIQEKWAKARDEFIAGKGDLDWKGRNAASNEFWEMIDTKLDLNLRDARRKAS